MLVLTRKKDEKIIIGDSIEITVVELDNGRVKLGIEAPADVEIVREELFRQVENENKEAVKQSRIDIGALMKMGKNSNKGEKES